MGARREPRQLRHEHHKVPVTALDICSDDVVLAGEGVNLVAYNVDKKIQLGHLQVFRSQAIHKLLSNGKEIVVCGGSLIAYVRLHRNGDGAVELESLGSFKDTGDWILDAAFAPVTDLGSQLCVALITAHNSLIKCSLNFSQGDDADTFRIHAETVVPGSNCILYCAHITWLSDSLCLIASGTAFGDIILWSSLFSLMDSKELKATTHYVFPAHEGSVFGTQISLPLSEDVLGGPSRVLASCSDDRTVRLWDISDLSCESPSMTDIQRETGFGSTVQSNAHAPLLLAKAMGHISRIWSVRFISKNRIHSENSPETSQLAIASFGEDASRITWDVKKTTRENGGPRYELEHSQTHSLHTGKNIWSQGLREDRCVTGGADGSIALLPSAGIWENIVEIGNELLVLPPDETRNPLNDAFKSYAFVGKDTLVATTAQGRIVALTLSEDGTTAIESHGGYESLKSFSMVTSAFGVAFIAGIGGCVHIWPMRTRRCASVASLPGKVAGIFLSQPLGATEPSVEAVPTVLVTTVGGKAAYLTHICPTVEADGLESYNTEQHILELEPVFIVTSFLLVSLCNADFAVLGSRNGSLAIYRLSSTADEQPIGPAQTLDKCHGKDAVTALEWSTAKGQEGKGYLYSTGRDGTYAVRRATFRQSELSFELVHQLELPFGPNIEGLNLTGDRHVRLWGFKSKTFIVHEATSHQNIMTVPCGGVHRNWAYESSTNGGTFVWTKASTLMRATQSRLPHQSIHAGGHGREIKATAVSPGTYQIIATGAEDTDIKLFLYSQAGFKCLQTLRKHNTGIQHLQWSSQGDYLFSSAGFEEFHIWRICHDVPFVNVGVVCESTHPRSGSSDLRIMGFEANEQSVHEHGSAAFEIVMVYSDSSIKRWHYGNETWTLQDLGDYLTACLTDALNLPTSDGSRSGGRLMTTATDGHIALWAEQAGGKLAWEQRHKVHQNAILTSSAHALSDGSFLLVTAGDDNGLGITRVNVEGEVSTLLIPRAHAAAVTALAVHPVDEDQFSILTAGIDQRVKIWNLRADVSAKDVDGIQVSKAQNAFTSVADVSSMSLLQLEDGCMGIVICGVGMDVWRLEGSMST